MKPIIFFLTLAFLLGLTSFNSEANASDEPNFDELFSIEQILDDSTLTELSRNILKPDHPIGQSLQDEINSEFEYLGLDLDQIDLLSKRYIIKIDKGCADSTQYKQKPQIFMKSLKRQIYEVAKYITLLHKSTLGHRYATFTLRNFVICSTQYKNSFITYEHNDTLYINNDLFFKTQINLRKKQAHAHSQFFTTDYLTMADLQETWNKGLIFPESDNKLKKESILEKIAELKANNTWQLLNPYGLFRTSLRKIIHEYRLRLSEKMKEQKSLDQLSLFDKITEDIDLEKLPNELQDAYADLQSNPYGENYKKRIIQIYQSYLKDENLFQEISLAKISAVQDALAQEKNRKNTLFLVQIGAVNVSNHHDIKIEVNLYKEFKKLLQVDADDIIERRIFQIGLVNVYTIDDIDVSLLVDSSEIKTLLFGKALKAIKGLIANHN